MNRLPSVISAAAVAAGLGVSGQADAATVVRFDQSHGTANCQSALPVFDGNMRKRPLAVANEGTGTAFVTCDTESINIFGTGFSGITVFFANRGSSAVTISCTLVNGRFNTSATFFPKTTAPIAPGAFSSLLWAAVADNGGPNFSAPATSCALPPNTEIGIIEFVYSEEIGD